MVTPLILSENTRNIGGISGRLKMRQSYGIRKSKALHQHWTWKGGMMKAKMQFKTLDDCLEYMDKHYINKNKYHPYVCPDCGLWHIGHNKK